MAGFLERMGFSSSSQAQQPQPQQPQQFPQGQGQQQLSPQQQGALLNGDVARANGNGGEGQPQGQQTDPLAPFAKMFDNPANPEVAPSFALPQDQLSKLASGQNFINGLNPELMQKALGGDMQAFMEVINSVGQKVYESSLGHGARLTEGFVGAREGFNQKSFGKNVRAELTNGELSNGLQTSNPVVRKALTETAQRLQAQYPDYSPKEIADMAKTWVTELAKATNPDAFQSQQQGQQGQKQSNSMTAEDWDTWFESPAANRSF